MKRHKPKLFHIDRTNMGKYLAVGVELSHGGTKLKHWLLHPTKGWRPR